MKIACIIHSLDGGGAERVMAATASRLRKRGHDVVLFTLDDGKKNRHELDPSVQRVSLDLMRQSTGLIDRIRNRRRRIEVIRQSIHQCSPDVVLSFCDRTNIAVLSALKGTGIPCVASERSDPAQQYLGWFWEWMRRKNYNRAAQLIALTDTSAKHLAKICPAVPIHVIPSAVDNPPVKSNRDQAIENKRVVAVGRLEHEKGFDRLLNAFAAATASYPKWSLLIYGEGSLRESLLQQAREIKVDDQLTMPGWVRPIWPDLSEATIFVLPSRYEGFPSALMESMACGVPSVSVDCESGPRAIIVHEQNALLVENTQQALADAIKRLIEDAELRESIGQRGRDVVDRFSWDKMIEEYESVLLQAAKQDHQR